MRGGDLDVPATAVDLAVAAVSPLLALRQHGKLSVGMAKKIGCRVFVGLTVDERGIVTAGLVLRGVTVFALGKPNSA